MENASGNKPIQSYTWKLESELKPILRELNLKSFRKRQNIYLAIAILAMPFAFFMSYYEFQESLSTSVFGALGIGSLFICFWLVLLLALKTKAFYPESMCLAVYENGKKELKIDKNQPIDINTWNKVGETESNTIIQVRVVGVQCFVPIPTNIFKAVSQS